jgi:hypothetical protein
MLVNLVPIESKVSLIEVVSGTVLLRSISRGQQREDVLFLGLVFLVRVALLGGDRRGAAVIFRWRRCAVEIRRGCGCDCRFFLSLNETLGLAWLREG